VSQIAYTPKQIPDATGIDSRHVDRAIRSMELPLRKIGDQVVVSRLDLEEWVQSLPIMEVQNN